MSYQKSELELNREQDALTNKAKKDKERFEQVVITQNKIKHIKTDLNQLIQAMQHDPSLFSRAASFWDEIPLWQKVLGGVGCSVPLLIIGVLAHLAVLITLSIVTAIGYTGGHILLENHQRHNTDSTQSLKTGISSLVDLLDTVISTLEILHQQLALEIESFQKENERMSKSIGELSGQITTLTSQIKVLNDTEQALRLTQSELERTVKTLKDSIAEQSQVLDETQKELKRVAQEYKNTQNQLADKIIELDAVKERLSKEVDQAQSIILVLRGTVEALSQSVIADGERRTAFQSRLNDFITNKEQSFDQVAERICEAERKLSAVTQQLEESNKRYRELLDRQELQIIRMEQMDAEQPEAALNSCNGVRPSINGFYAIKKEPPFFAVPNPGASPIAVM
jgi:uncharacterized coiled-coil protein SlyX